MAGVSSLNFPEVSVGAGFSGRVFMTQTYAFEGRKTSPQAAPSTKEFPSCLRRARALRQQALASKLWGLQRLSRFSCYWAKRNAPLNFKSRNFIHSSRIPLLSPDFEISLVFFMIFF